MIFDTESPELANLGTAPESGHYGDKLPTSVKQYINNVDFIDLDLKIDFDKVPKNIQKICNKIMRSRAAKGEIRKYNNLNKKDNENYIRIITLYAVFLLTDDNFAEASRNLDLDSIKWSKMVAFIKQYVELNGDCMSNIKKLTLTDAKKNVYYYVNSCEAFNHCSLQFNDPNFYCHKKHIKKLNVTEFLIKYEGVKFYSSNNDNEMEIIQKPKSNIKVGANGFCWAQALGFYPKTNDINTDIFIMLGMQKINQKYKDYLNEPDLDANVFIDMMEWYGIKNILIKKVSNDLLHAVDTFNFEKGKDFEPVLQLIPDTDGKPRRRTLSGKKFIEFKEVLKKYNNDWIIDMEENKEYLITLENFKSIIQKMEEVVSIEKIETINLNLQVNLSTKVTKFYNIRIIKITVQKNIMKIKVGRNDIRKLIGVFLRDIDSIMNDNEQFANVIRDNEVEDLKAVLKGRTKNIHFAHPNMSDDAILNLSESFSSFLIVRGDKEMHPHGYYANSRVLNETLICNAIGGHVPIFDLGGNYYRHLNNGRLNVHSCLRVSNLEEQSRLIDIDSALLKNMSKTLNIIKEQNKTNTTISNTLFNISKAINQITSNNSLSYFCNNSVLNCDFGSTYPISFGMSIDSLFDVHPFTVLKWHQKKKDCKIHTCYDIFI